jgi:hypothetical protein
MLKLETPFFGVTLFRHPTLDGGPRVCTVLVRLGRKYVL